MLTSLFFLIKHFTVSETDFEMNIYFYIPIKNHGLIIIVKRKGLLQYKKHNIQI